ncbi:MAG: site-specific tyrosine recombinase [Planctomycetota bacterium]|jgi:integrase/recombinase XerD
MRSALEQYEIYLSAECGLSRHTIAAYRRDVGRLIAYLEREVGKSIPAARPGAVEPDHVRAFLWLEERRGLASRSLARALVAIKGLFRFLVGEGQLERSLMETIEAPRVPKTLPHPLTEAEIGRLLDAPFPDTPLGHRDRAVLELLYATGARVSEVCDINTASIDLEVGYLRVKGKGRKERIVPLGRRARLAVRAYLEGARDHLVRNGAKEEPALLLSTHSRRLSRHSAWRLVKARCRALGLPASTSPHSLRHSFATHLLANGAGIRSVQEMLGHATIATTQVYTKVDRSHLRKVHAKFHPRG